MDSIRLEYLVKEVDTCYNEYEPTKAGRLISDFVNDNLSNWYVRRTVNVSGVVDSLKISSLHIRLCIHVWRL